MVTSSSLVAACSIFVLSFAAPVQNNVATRSMVARDSYIMFGGDGTMATGWPSRKFWLGFEDAWKANLQTMRESCQVEGWGENNSDAEMQAIKDSIVAESKATDIPKEFILAIIMQESKGCVRAPTTHWSHDNPGLMQSAQGKGTCNPNGKPISPCPKDTIRLMIHDGTSGDGLETTLKQCLADAGTSDDSKWYKAARLYNAGRITDNNLGIGPTPCYTSDIANRLVKPFNWSTCNNAVIGTLSSAQGTIDKGNSDLKGSTPATNTVDVPSVAPELIISGAAEGCTDYYIPQSGDTCLSAPVDFATLRALNTHLDSKCTNLWAGYAYCIAA